MGREATRRRAPGTIPACSAHRALADLLHRRARPARRRAADRRFDHRAALQREDADMRVLLVARTLRRGGEALGHPGGDLELRLAVLYLDPADLLPRHMAAAAEERQHPARIGIAVGPAEIHPEPDAFLLRPALARHPRPGGGPAVGHR